MIRAQNVAKRSKCVCIYFDLERNRPINRDNYDDIKYKKRGKQQNSLAIARESDYKRPDKRIQ